MSFVRFINQLTFLLLPPRCVLCEETCQISANICLACQKNLPILSYYCQQCARSLPPNTPQKSRCGHCLQSPPPFERSHALFTYEFPIVHLMTDLKFRHQLSHAKALSQLLIPAIKNEWYANEPLPDLILPIPLHPKRMQERGFNQAIEIAKPVAKALHIPLDLRGIQRIKATAMQSTLPAKDRKQNVQGAFLSTRSYAGKTIALVDDVITTGNTVSACSLVLKKAGAKTIHVWCCARAC